MATNKAKRSIHLAQPQPQPQHNQQPPTKLMPVKAHIYRAIADLNAGLELTLQELNRLQQADFLPSARIAAMHKVVGELRAQANRDFLRILGQRETANTAHFERLHTQPESKPPETPSAG
jgi:hypothetical protein